MPHTTKYKRGDIVLVDFGFSEGTGAKKRPAKIISSDNYHKGRQEVGLIYLSLVTGIIRTIKDNMIIHKLGTLLQQDFQKVQKNLGKAMGF